MGYVLHFAEKDISYKRVGEKKGYSCATTLCYWKKKRSTHRL